MFLKVQLFIWSLLIWTTISTLRDNDWERLLPALTKLCPDVDFCEKTQTDKQEANTGKNHCFRGCSCNTNCTKTRDCCDGTVDDVDLLSDCLVPSTNQDLIMNKYRFIAKPPAGGCIQHPGQRQGYSVTCSLDEKVAPWGNFYPAYSRSLDANFKNEPCARCHGAIDAKNWTSILHIDYAPDFFGTLASFIENGTLNGSSIVFSPPNSESSRYEMLCFREKTSCPSYTNATFYITSDVEMDRPSIKEACEHGPRARYLSSQGQAFKNVFCALCNGFSSKFNDEMRCVYTQGFDKDLNPPIRVLIDKSYMTAIKKNTIDRKGNGVCYRPEPQKNESDCEAAYCPSMQTRDQAGKCGFVVKFLVVENLFVCLNLSIDQGRDNQDVIQMTDTKIHSLFQESSPWSNKWFITYIGYLINGRRPRSFEFLVCLKLKSSQTNMESLLKEIQSTLRKRWMVNIDPISIFDQEITKHGQTYFGFVGLNTTALWTTYTSSSNFTDLTQPTWKSLYSVDFRIRSPLYFNQMFMCEQIQLKPDEYIQDSPYGILYQTKTRKYLYPNQFTVMVKPDNTWSVRVCLKDSGYAKVVSGAETSQQRAFMVTMVYLFYSSVGMFTDTD